MVLPTPAPCAVAGADGGGLRLQLQLQVLILAQGERWQAQLTTPGGERLQFESPFELVRYLTQLARQPPPPHPGLR